MGANIDQMGELNNAAASELSMDGSRPTSAPNARINGSTALDKIEMPELDRNQELDIESQQRFMTHQEQEEDEDIWDQISSEDEEDNEAMAEESNFRTNTNGKDRALANASDKKNIQTNERNIVDSEDESESSSSNSFLSEGISRGSEISEEDLDTNMVTSVVASSNGYNEAAHNGARNAEINYGQVIDPIIEPIISTDQGENMLAGKVDSSNHHYQNDHSY